MNAKVSTVDRAKVAALLKKAVVGHYVKLRYGVYTEIGLTYRGTLRADVLALNYKKHIVVCEIKSSYADWSADSKWPTYLAFCDKFLFVFAQATWDKYGEKIKPSVEARGAGVMVLDSKTGYLRSVVPARTQEFLEDRETLILRMAYRGDFTKRNTAHRKVFIQ